jgi:hypothetical protein
MTSQKPVVMVVVPARPPIDKLVAFKRVQLDLRDEVRLEVAFCGVNEPNSEHLALWQSNCSAGRTPYLIDVGKKKYHKLSSSAAQVEKMFSDTQSGSIFNKLVELVNQNNKSGFLKERRYSVAKILREAYHVMNGGEYSQEVVFDHGMDVVNAFFFIQNRREWNTLFNDPQYLKLRELWYGFNVIEKEILPFTLPLYFKQLFTSGRSEAEIISSITWWLDKAQRVASAHDSARNKTYRPRLFHIQRKAAGLIHINGHFEAEAAQYQWVGSGKFVIGIFRNDLGQVHVKCSVKHKGIDLYPFFVELKKLEPGKWYLEQRFKGIPMLMNGSSQFFDVTPTTLSDDDLIEMASRLVKLPQ